MPPADKQAARELLSDLEAQWVSLLIWIAEQPGQSAETMVASLGEQGQAALDKHASERRREAFTPIHFLDFQGYSQIASLFKEDFARLGAPPSDWVERLNRMNQEGLARYRNHLSHGDRFDRLNSAEQATATRLFREQLEALRAWWPTCPAPASPPPVVDPVRAAIQLLGDDPTDAVALAQVLGMAPNRFPQNLIPPGEYSELARALDGYALRVYQAGAANVAGPKDVPLYLVYLNDWPEQASKRERSRRRVAKALIEYQPRDIARLIILLDGNGQADEVELLLTRPEGTIRATLTPSAPNRYHVDLVKGLVIGAGTNRPALRKQWAEAFSVEAVTRHFYAEFSGLRDRLIEDLLAHNPDHPALAGKDPKTDREFALTLTAFGTRQLSRILFLWFLQQKRWLGGHPGAGNPSLLVHLFSKTSGQDRYFTDVLVPIFFDGVGLREGDDRHGAVEDITGYLPYLNGGLFRAEADAFERDLFGVDEHGNRTRDVILPNDLFDPRKDGLATPGRRRGDRRRSVFGLLQGYRFTTQESTPDDQSVDPDPELLGRVFENLYQADDRHQSGAYYTPREIVRYMCREALDGVLRDRARVTQADLDRIRAEAADWSADDTPLGRGVADRIRATLDGITILDPAVGSGAFLVGALQEIVLLRRGLEQAERNADISLSSEMAAEWKLEAIKNNLFGVDINPMAVEICRLRLWLSLVIDREVVHARDIIPLPNLDFRVVAGDSLIDRMGSEAFAQSLPMRHVQINFEMEAAQREIADLQRRFEAEKRTAELLRLQGLIHDKRIETVRLQIGPALTSARVAAANAASVPRPSRAAIARANAAATQLAKLYEGLNRNASYQKPLLWPLTFPDVFAEGGFDIVLANPPYVSQALIDPLDQEAYARAFPEVSAGTSDLYVYFFARALQVVRPGGMLAFVTSNRYMKVGYGERLRSYLPRKLQIDRIIDFGDVPVFEVSAYPAILIGRRQDEPDMDRSVSASDLSIPIKQELIADSRSQTSDNVRATLERLPGVIASHAIEGYPQILLSRTGWYLVPPAVHRLLEALDSAGQTFGSIYGSRVRRGVTTGDNDVFVLSGQEADALRSEDPSVSEILFPYVSGTNVKRWRLEPDTRHLLFTRRGIDISEYPSALRYLEQFRQQLEPRSPGAPRDSNGRKAGSYRWYEIQDDTAYWRDFLQHKIVWKKTAYRPSFSLDLGGYFLANTVHFIASDEPWLCGVLNSSIMEFVMYVKTVLMRGGYIELTPKRLDPLPLPRIAASLQIELSSVVTRYVQEGVGSEEDIDRLVGEAFGLSSSETTLIIEFLAGRRLMQPAEVSADQDDD